MTKFGAAENEMKRLTAKFAQGTPAEYSLLSSGENFRFGRKGSITMAYLVQISL